MLLPTPGHRAGPRPTSPGGTAATAPSSAPRRRSGCSPRRCGRPASGTWSAPRTATRPAGRRCPASRQLLQRIAGDLDVLTYLGEYTRGRLEPALGRRTQAGPALARASTSSASPRTPTAPPSGGGTGWATRPVVVCVSRLVARKGQDVLMPAGRGCSPRHPDARLLLVGGGPAEASLRRRGRRGWAWSGSVVLTGPVPPDRAAGALRRRRRVRHAVPHPARRPGRRGPRHRLPGGLRHRPAGRRRRLRRRPGRRAGRRDRARRRPARRRGGRRRRSPPARRPRPRPARWAPRAGPGSSSAWSWTTIAATFADLLEKH